MKAQRDSRGIVLLVFNLDARRGVWMVNATPRTTLHPGKRKGTHCTVDWVGPRAGLEGCGNPPHPDSVPGSSIS